MTNTIQRVAMQALAVSALAVVVVAVKAQDRGAAVYAQYCLACHGSDGAGMTPGVPDLTDPAGVLVKPDPTLLRSLLEGVQKSGAPLAMPPKGGNSALTDSDMRAVLAFVRREFDPTSRQPTGVR